VETHHDDAGIVWPLQVAPFEVAVVLLNGDDERSRTVAEEIYGRLTADRIEVLLDDREERPGAKFKDVELIGIPYRITVGSRGLAGGTVEITTRTTRETVTVPAGEAAELVRTLVTASPGPQG
jgi:prolyl-tRNA synthetase